MLVFNFSFSINKIPSRNNEFGILTNTTLIEKYKIVPFSGSKNELFDTIKKVQLKKNADLKGSVLNETGESQEFVEVSLFRSVDSTFVKGTLTDSLGLFHLSDIVPGNYYLKAYALGSAPFYSDVIKLEENATVVSPPLILVPDVNKLNEVVITKKIDLVERKSDRFVIKVKESALAAGTSLDLLKNTPFVTISAANEVSLQSKKTLVLIDNKQYPDSSVESVLQMIPAGNIVTIELITNPSSKYDATYGAVINIITKKSQMDGYTGNVRVTGAQGQYGEYGANASLTYRKGKLTTFGTLGYRKSDQMSFNNTVRILNGTDVINEDVKRVFYQKFYSVQGGIQYDLTDRQYIGALITTNPFRRTGHFDSTNEFSKLNAPIDSVLVTNSPLKSKGYTSNYNLNYHYSSKSGDTELNALGTYTPYQSDFFQSFPSYVLGKNDEVIRVPNEYQTTNSTGIDIWIAQLDFIQNLKKEWKLEAGLKNQTSNSNSQIVYEENQNGSNVVVPEYSNDTKLRETILSGYGILYKNREKDKLQIGMRLENTDATYTGGEPQQYLKFFPTLFYQHDIDDLHNYSFSYKKTIIRTPYNELVPYTIFINNYTVFTGNPALKPQYNDNFSLGINLNKLNISINYVYIKGMLGQFPYKQDFDTGVTYFSLQNLDQSHDFYIDVFYPIKITSWWNSQNSGSVSGYSKSKGIVLGNQYSLSSFWYNFKTDHTISFSKNLKLEVIGTYSSKLTSELTHIGAVGNIDASFLINVLKNKGQIRVMATDILKRNVYTSDQYFSNYSSEKMRYNDSRKIGIEFTYNFGNVNTKRPAKKLGNDDALDRIQ
ncbi:MAG: TonB-dependent receptor [Flavobacterium sp.]|uniref:outer membrane beta-barrel protein n=1 Tax=Flavobacterium sp. TaxID=239 RepID=UPI001B27E438|nr:outer membrane beta-barrel protein [Flavobacterium sp.]MBO9586222.1 TonB-dependent receptor [Flavobacterium sp.]